MRASNTGHSGLYVLTGAPSPASRRIRQQHLKATGIIMVSMPMVSIYPLLGQRYGLGDVCAAALMIATIVAVATITVITWLIAP